MKKVFTLMIVGMFLFSLMGTFVLADTEVISASGDVEGVEIAPVEEVTDSSGIFWNKLQMRFTFNKQKKAEMAVKIADKRMLRVAEYSETGKLEKAKTAEKNYQKALIRAESCFEDVIENGDEESVKRALARTIMVQNRIEAHNEKVLEIHSGILENKADQMTEEQLTHLGEVFSNMQERSENAEDKISQQQENLRAKYKVLTGVTDEEIDAKMGAYDSFLDQQREQRQQRIETYLQKQESFRDGLASSDAGLMEQVETIEQTQSGQQTGQVISLN